ncbi:MAG TPA: penicillin-binding transpeptidase domain-containing protein [Bacilli bacterium]|nr:penicillin-binding transpeptidase domain-containing protein [Bacilli bacterium]
MKKKNNTVRINKFFILGIVFLFGTIIIKMGYIGITHSVDNTNLKTFAANRDTVKKTLYATRGTIYDTNGEVLAQNVNSYTVIAFLDESRTTDPDNPQHVVDKEYTAEKLYEVFSENIKTNSMTKDDILALLSQEGLYQVELGPSGRGITELVKEEIEDLNLPGISFISSTKRYYQMGNFASYAIGYAKKDEDGKIAGEMGIESYFNDYLSGTDGYTEYQQDAYGYQIANTPAITDEPKDGADVYLTLDSTIQLKLENAIKEITDKYNLTWMTITIADAKTGAILGTASAPNFNPNTLDISSYLTPLTQYAYEPGSTMKIFSFMAAMENGVYDGDETYESGTLKIGDITIKDFNNVGWGTITYNEGFSYSSNVAAAKLAQKMGGTKLKAYYRLLGFGSQTGIELPNESSGTVNFKYDIEISNAAFGQGITTTPIQTIQALTAIANDGVTLKPYIVDRVVDSDTGEILYKNQRTEVAKVASSETVEAMKDMMKDVVYSGLTSAKYYQTDRVTLIGKTGTAQIPSKNGGYLTGDYNYIRSFAGLFPYEDPQYIVYMSVKQLVGPLKSVANLVSGIVEDIATYKNIANTTLETSKIIPLENYISTDATTSESELEALGLDAILIGNGDVIINQYPKKGTLLGKNEKVFLLTNGDDYKMPYVIGWSASEIKNYCNFINLKCEYDGYGYVSEVSLDSDSTINKKETINITLNDKYEKYLTTETEEVTD